MTGITHILAEEKMHELYDQLTGIYPRLSFQLMSSENIGEV